MSGIDYFQISKRLRSPGSYVAGPSYNTIRGMLQELDELRIQTPFDLSVALRAHLSAAHGIIGALNAYPKGPEYDLDVLAIHTFGACARRDPSSPREDVDLNVFVREMPHDSRTSLAIEKITKRVCTKAVRDATPGILPDTHAANLYDMDTIEGFCRYTGALVAIEGYARGDKQALTTFCEGNKLGSKKTEILYGIANGRSCHLRLYPQLTTPALPYQMTAYPELVVDREPRTMSHFYIALDDIALRDPIYRSDFRRFLEFEIARAKERRGIV